MRRAVARINLLIEAEGWKRLPEAKKTARSAAQAALKFEKRKGEATILLTDDAAMRRLNASFRGKDKPTNVLSFPAAPSSPGNKGAESLFLGDIALGYETCAAEALAEGKSLGDHLSHLVVHGLLHLMGYDHETEAQALQMEGRERAVLAMLGVADPYSGAEEAPLDE
ncbi:MAG: rRNA maturation RNase YbeY [Rhizobiales bacterium]|nr:rRNA maturation RNase YbeY [Hyphomicrobiales bacterium]